MKSRNLFIGLFFIIAAGVFVVNEVGLLGDISTFQLAAVIFLIPIIILCTVKRYFFGVFFPLAVLGVSFSEELGIAEYTGWPIWVVALCLSIGLSLIFGKGLSVMWTGDFVGFGGEESISDDENDETINHSVTFGDSIKYANSTNLRRGRLTSTFGELTVYFDNASINPEGATIYVNATFSEVNIYMPKEWAVINELGSIMSDVKEKRTKQEEGSSKVKLVGKAVFSEVSIIYV
ncbi:MAG: LiaF-related protein [Oscillospiraceae bacterium]|nr:LiaF-related protein [Oscillospiraceae bacterium]